ncbi:hypothetical protein NF27_CG00460 [Candidatus Jidaibacter acanthamoeba]|uniref:Uncharacterized protein n=1 Tax=Candidatus Jidaibacter acanthamoebae TaxID=86105 RepID=A0A0C1N0M5_9RICK|nr:hypothetical protein [Candidatus Jidaibacter acanthamoeba]KIE05866.1 hypothetical protein NF27_CG00460 [Candidatus Jidaibacter acanthamoeba]
MRNFVRNYNPFTLSADVVRGGFSFVKGTTYFIGKDLVILPSLTIASSTVAFLGTALHNDSILNYGIDLREKAQDIFYSSKNDFFDAFGKNGLGNIAKGISGLTVHAAITNAISLYYFNFAYYDLKYQLRVVYNHALSQASSIYSYAAEKAIIAYNYAYTQTTSILNTASIEISTALQPYYNTVLSHTQPIINMANDSVNSVAKYAVDAFHDPKQALTAVQNYVSSNFSFNYANAVGLLISSAQLYGAYSTFKNFNELAKLGVNYRFSKYAVTLAELGAASVTALQSTGLYTFTPEVVLCCMAAHAVGHYVINSLVNMKKQVFSEQLKTERLDERIENTGRFAAKQVELLHAAEAKVQELNRKVVTLEKESERLAKRLDNTGAYAAKQGELLHVEQGRVQERNQEIAALRNESERLNKRLKKTGAYAADKAGQLCAEQGKTYEARKALNKTEAEFALTKEQLAGQRKQNDFKDGILGRLREHKYEQGIVLAQTKAELALTKKYCLEAYGERNEVFAQGMLNGMIIAGSVQEGIDTQAQLNEVSNQLARTQERLQEVQEQVVHLRRFNKRPSGGFSAKLIEDARRAVGNAIDNGI